MTIKLTFAQNEIYQLLLESPKSLTALRVELNYRLDKIRDVVDSLLLKGVVKNISYGVYEAIRAEIDVETKKSRVSKPKQANVEIKVSVPDKRMKISLTDKQRKLIIENLPKINSNEMKRTALAKLVEMRKMDLCYVLEYELYKVGS